LTDGKDEVIDDFDGIDCFCFPSCVSCVSWLIPNSVEMVTTKYTKHTNKARIRLKKRARNQSFKRHFAFELRPRMFANNL
jgi:hypothetical protein